MCSTTLGRCSKNGSRGRFNRHSSRIVDPANGFTFGHVSQICAGLDVEAAVFGDRSLAQLSYPFVFLNAMYCAKLGSITAGAGHP